MSTQSVPVIDIAPFLAGDRDDVVRQVREACEGIGFFTIVGHGVEPEIIAELCGYRAIGDEGLAYGSGEETPPDLKEVFHMGPPDFPADAYHTDPAAAAHFIENVYPDEPASFRAAATAYYHRLEKLG